MAAPWIKLCGLTRPEDARLALDLGACYLGCVLVPASPRCVTPAQACALSAVAGERLVAVVRDLPPEALEALIATVHPGVLQLHGAETPAHVRQLREAYPEVALWKVLAVAPLEADLDRLLAEAQAYEKAGVAALVLDTRVVSGSGGTGQTGDWAAAAALVRRVGVPVVLAGGLNPENLQSAAAQVQPAGLDVSSGVEESPGRKSPDRLQALFAVWKRLAVR